MTRFTDVWDALDRLRQITADKAYADVDDEGMQPDRDYPAGTG